MVSHSAVNYYVQRGLYLHNQEGLKKVKLCHCCHAGAERER